VPRFSFRILTRRHPIAIAQHATLRAATAPSHCARQTNRKPRAPDQSPRCAAIKKAPGARAEQLAEALGVGTKELALPIAKLFDDKSIKSTGQRRGTKYFPR
jgi:hypothetical protein